MRYDNVMVQIFEDKSLGLKLRGYLIVPNDALENMIAIYTLRIAQDILSENFEIVDGWLHKIHEEYMSRRRACDFESDPVACFNLSVYEEFERHLNSWNDGGMIAISLPGNRTMRLSKKPLFLVSKTPAEICGECRMTFATVKEILKHYKEKHPESIEKVLMPV